MLGPQPHPYRRIKRGKDDGLTLAVQDWRVLFETHEQDVRVLALHTGYRASQLAEGVEDPTGQLRLHREFAAQFASG